MISFWVDAAGTFTMEQYLLTRAPQLADRIELRRYEELSPDLDAAGGTHIFAALDQLTPGGLEAVISLSERLSASRPPHPLLNDPRRVRQRHDLLASLFDAGINRYRAYRATNAADARFPVFVREESEHNGPLTGLLNSGREVARALLTLRARGYRQADLLVVEFCDLLNADGLYRTASAFRVGERIVPAHLLSGKNWMLKWEESEHGERAMQEHLDYVLGNPHQARLRRVFDLAGVEYGRIDYGMRGDTLQVWEINTNPTLGPSRNPPLVTMAPNLEAMLHKARTVHHDAMRAAFQSLDTGQDDDRMTVRLDAAPLARMKAETLKLRRRRAALRFLHGVYGHPVVGRIFRAAYSRFLPRM
ncbi:MAG TPA: hypothetical protein VF187_00280 [Gemmatimonadales bacterium]